jgi:hypothetical protein
MSKEFPPLSYLFHINNDIQLQKNIEEIPLEQDLKFASVGVSNIDVYMYPGTITPVIKDVFISKNISPSVTEEILQLSDTVLKQRYCPLIDTALHKVTDWPWHLQIRLYIQNFISNISNIPS